MQQSAGAGRRTPREMLRAFVAALPDNVTGARALVESIGNAPAEMWPEVVDEAVAHGVLGIIAPYLSESQLPCTVRQDIERRAVIQQLWDQHVVESLEHALVVLDEAGIRACVLKGPVLAERLYPERAVRQSMDIDLLVRPSDIGRAVAVLREAGYTGDSEEHASYLLRHGHHLHFTRAGTPPLELHFHAYAGFGALLPASALMDGATAYRVSDRVVALVPRPEDEFVYLAIHAAGHSFIRLVWLYDLKLLLRRNPTLDWERVAAQAAASGVSPPVAYAIGLLQAWLGVSTGALPPSLRRRGLRMWVADRLLIEVSAPQNRSARDNLGGLLFTSLLCDRFASTLWLLQHHTFRTTRRRMHRAAPRLFPPSWSA